MESITIPITEEKLAAMKELTQNLGGAWGKVRFQPNMEDRNSLPLIWISFSSASQKVRLKIERAKYGASEVRVTYSYDAFATITLEELRKDIQRML